MKRHILSPEDKCYPAKGASNHEDEAARESDHGCSNHDICLDDLTDNVSFPPPRLSKNCPSVSSFPSLRKESVYKYNPSINKCGYFDWRLSYNMSIPTGSNSPQRSDIAMNTLELELMLFINEYFLPP